LSAISHEGQGDSVEVVTGLHRFFHLVRHNSLAVS
jgi:hypothetical protein